MTAQGLHVYTNGGNTRSSACLEAMCGGAGGARQPASKPPQLSTLARSHPLAPAGAPPPPPRLATIQVTAMSRPAPVAVACRSGPAILELSCIHDSRGGAPGAAADSWVGLGRAVHARHAGLNGRRLRGALRLHTACSAQQQAGGSGSSGELFAGTQGCRRGEHTQPHKRRARHATRPANGCGACKLAHTSCICWDRVSSLAFTAVNCGLILLSSLVLWLSILRSISSNWNFALAR